ncbi:MAG: 23S rRNA (guanosine(2251)-2'-O)-methyltransferase RlmB [Anaerolineae bacterium]|nr:23S rRNA (guanosine(2251)-2'-O)-methyltransferase RlmB [Anaerolineae bacterium]
MVRLTDNRPRASHERLYGRQAVREALRAGRRQAIRLWLAEGVRETDVVAEIVALAEAAGCPVQRRERRELDRLVSGNQGVVLEASPYPYADLADILALARQRGEPPLLLVLDHLEDPRNVGALLRTAEAVGVHGVVLPRRRSAAITPVASDTSAGAAEHLRVAQVTNLARTLAELKQAGLWVAGLEALPEAQPYDAVDLGGPLALVVGSEGRGLSRLVRERCDWLLKLPLRGRVGSLNAAVAASIVLYQVLRCRETRER